VGRIDLFDTYSYFGVATSHATRVMNELQQMAYRDRPLKLGIADENSAKPSDRKPDKQYAGNRNKKKDKRRW
ncbi:MAG: DbpA RNA binding domain-containing protein, partial [Bacteroidales bacterium]|jgi:hypothetical protein|nr:DbpA RNA binding domain-containing protein [Bacteroidales bacterium]